MGVSLTATGLSREFKADSGRTTRALDNVSLSVSAGEFLTIVGPSGCGKTTFLNLIAGIDHPDVGSIEFGDDGSTRIGMVFQGNSVFPWLTVERNLSFSMEAAGMGRAQWVPRVEALCNTVGLDPSEHLKKYPSELSGGERRRVAIGMALSMDVGLLLFDEPTSQLDYVARFQIGQTIQHLWQARRFTAIFVTHDIDEAIRLGDRVVLMNGGSKASEVEVDLPRPRDMETLASAGFADIRRRILTAFGAQR